MEATVAIKCAVCPRTVYGYRDFLYLHDWKCRRIYELEALLEELKLTVPEDVLVAASTKVVDKLRAGGIHYDEVRGPNKAREILAEREGPGLTHFPVADEVGPGTHVLAT